MKVLIVGLGSIGKRQAKILQESFKHQLYAYRSNKEAQTNELGIPEVYTWKEVEDIKPDVAFITNPTFMHIPIALECANRGMHLFVEKPLSHTMEGLSQLKELCRRKELTCYVAYCLRFHPVIERVKEIIADKKIYHIRSVCSSYLPQWRFGTDHLKSYSASAKQGGGVLLDVSHELDYIAYLFGPLKTLNGKYAKVSDVTCDSEDYADMVITTEKNIVVNLHLNFMSRLLERKCIVDYKEGYCVGDLIENKVVYETAGKKEVCNFDFKRNAMFKKQAEYFFNNLGNKQIMNNLEEAEKILKKIIEFKDV